MYMVTGAAKIFVGLTQVSLNKPKNGHFRPKLSFYCGLLVSCQLHYKASVHALPSPDCFASSALVLFGDGLPHRGDHFELSYASLPQKLWPCSPKKSNFPSKTLKNQSFLATLTRLATLKKILLGDGPPHRGDHFELSYAPLGQTNPVGDPKNQKFPSKR